MNFLSLENWWDAILLTFRSWWGMYLSPKELADSSQGCYIFRIHENLDWAHINNPVVTIYNLTIPLQTTQCVMVLERNSCVTVFHKYSHFGELAHSLFFCDWNRVALAFVNCKSLLRFLSGFHSYCLCFFIMPWCKTLLFLTFLTCCYRKPWPEGEKLLSVSLLAFSHVCVLRLQIWVAMVTGH